MGGPFNTYAVLQGVDKIVPTDVYVTGCPPRPENLFYALLKLQDKIDTMTLAKKPTEVRLDPNMVENFKRQVMIAQTLQPKVTALADVGEIQLSHFRLEPCSAFSAIRVFTEPTMAFIKIIPQARSPDATTKPRISLRRKMICIANVMGKISAMDNECLHLGGPLGKGVIEDGKVVCPWHGWHRTRRPVRPRIIPI